MALLASFYGTSQNRWWEIQEQDGRYAPRTKVPPKQRFKAELEDLCWAFACLLPQNEAALIVGQHRLLVRCRGAVLGATSGAVFSGLPQG